MANNGNTPEQWRQIALDLAANNGGKLPSFRRLGEMNLAALRTAFRRLPEIIEGIEREWEPRGSRTRTVDKWVKVAESIAKNNDGVLPSHHVLQSMGYGGLVMSMTRYRASFYHVKKTAK